MAPPQRTQLSQKEGRITLAIQAFKQGYFSSLKAACIAYDAPYLTVRDRVYRRVPRPDSRPKNLKLTPIEESTLIQWILSIEERGLLPIARTIRDIANLLL